MVQASSTTPGWDYSSALQVERDIVLVISLWSVPNRGCVNGSATPASIAPSTFCTPSVVHNFLP
jgi:hypothetical protein